jgi:large subunit ribosomal protein L9
MKVLLIQNVDNIGKQGEVKNVSGGFAENFLFPKKLAVIATDRVVAENKYRQNKLDRRVVAKKDDLEKNLDRLNNKTVMIKAKASDKGTLFKSIGSKEIIRLIKEQLNISLPEKVIRLVNPCKELGEHELTAAANNKTVIFKLKIEKDGQ